MHVCFCLNIVLFHARGSHCAVGIVMEALQEKQRGHKMGDGPNPTCSLLHTTFMEIITRKILSSLLRLNTLGDIQPQYPFCLRTFPHWENGWPSMKNEGGFSLWIFFFGALLPPLFSPLVAAPILFVFPPSLCLDLSCVFSLLSAVPFNATRRDNWQFYINPFRPSCPPSFCLSL